jgi:hypothetical protein
MPLPRGGTKEVGGGKFKSEVLLVHGATSATVLVFFDIYARFVDGFDDNTAFGLRHIAPAGMEDMVLLLTGTRNPNDTVLAFNRHAMLAVIQV